MLKFNLNGAPIVCSAEPSVSLLSFLRNDQHLTAAKDGCSAQAACGACLVEVDGKAALACVTPLSKVEGKNVVTLEGFPEPLKRTLGKAFVQKGAVQCGFCTPGFLTRAKILLQSNPDPSRDEVIKAVRPHLCRCTGYVKLVDAILEAARVLREGGEQELSCSVGTNSDSPRYKGYERAVGQRPFMDDLFFEGMLHGAAHFCIHPRARIIKVDVSAAEAMPGVKKVLTAKDIPGEQCSGLHVRDWPLYLAEGQISRCVGDILACAVAETAERARAAAAAVKVEYEVLEPLLDMELAENSPIMITEKGNLLARTAFTQGDPVDKVLADSAFTAEGYFETQAVEHAFLEPECSVARPDGNGGIKLYSMGQDITHDRKDVAAILNLPPEKLQVTLIDAGGGYGGKDDLTTQGHAALGALLLQKPVKVKFSRPESFRMHAKRHAVKMHYALGCDAKGKFTALKARIIGDSGAYASTGGPVMSRAAVHATGGYHFPNQDIESKAVYTNNLTAGAFRGFGVNQVVFAVESLVDELCLKGGFDRWQIRYDNAMDEGSLIPTGQILEKGASRLKACLLAVKDAFQSAKYAGIACAIKNAGFGNGIPEDSRCIIRVEEGGHIIIEHAWTEMGQGVHTAARQIFCEYTGISDNSIIDVRSSTSRGAFAGGTTASRGSFQLGHSILNAAREFKIDYEQAGRELKALAGRKYQGDYQPQNFTTPPAGAGEKPSRPVISHEAYSFAANVAICDEKGKISKIIAAHDSGRPINRPLYEGQVEGGVVMALGYALSEKIPFANGVFTSEKFRDFGLPRSTDVPPIEVIIVEGDDPKGPLGVKGIGEITCIAGAPAITNALRALDGVARYKLPVCDHNKS